MLSKVLKFIKRFNRLSNLRRFSTHFVFKSQNVAEHTLNVALLSMMIADRQKEVYPNIEIDYDWLFRRALLHDIEESKLGDIPWTVKNVDKRTSEFFDELSSKMNEPSPFELNNWDYVKVGLTAFKDDEGFIEGRIVETADDLDAFIYITNEIVLGNKRLQIIQDNIIGLLEEKEDLVLVKEILDEYKMSGNLHV